MPLDIAPNPGQTLKVTVSRTIKSEAAYKTLERLFMSDPEFSRPIRLRTRNFRARPKRRGGRIYTKYPRKVHPELPPGSTATIPANAQFVKDLKSVERYVSVEA
ncbi:MAG: hypothetical protein ACFCVE_06540 [Phycisphaerae bacterium]